MRRTRHSWVGTALFLGMNSIKVIALESFHGAIDNFGAKTRNYIKGEQYDLPSELAGDFIAAGFVEIFAEKKDEPKPKPSKSKVSHQSKAEVTDESIQPKQEYE